MPFKRYMPYIGFFRQCKVGLPGQCAVHFDEINFLLYETIYGSYCFFRCANNNIIFLQLGGAINNRAGNNAWTYSFSLLNFLFPDFDLLLVASHITNAGNSIGYKDIKENF